MKVQCTCGVRFNNLRQQREHSMLLAPYRHIYHPEHKPTKENSMNYSEAWAVTRTKPVYVLKSDARTKKNCFVSLDEIPMTEEQARNMAHELNATFRRTMKRNITR